MEIKKEENEITEFCKELQDGVQAIFPKSGVDCRTRKTHFGNEPYIDLSFTLYAKGEYPHNIIQNDPAFISISIDGIDPNNNGTVGDKLKVDSRSAGSFYIKSKVSHLAYQRIKTGWRDFSGTKDTVKRRLLEFFKKMKMTIKANVEDMDNPELAASKVNESRIHRFTSFVAEASNYPAGAEGDMNAPYNQRDPEPRIPASKLRNVGAKVTSVNSNGVNFTKDDEKLSIHSDEIDLDTIKQISINYDGTGYNLGGKDKDEENYDTDVTKLKDLSKDAIEAWINDCWGDVSNILNSHGR